MWICSERVWLHQSAASRRDGKTSWRGRSSWGCHRRGRHLQEWVTPSLKRRLGEWGKLCLWSPSLFPLAARGTWATFFTVCSVFMPRKSEPGVITQGKWLVAPAGAKAVVQINSTPLCYWLSLLHPAIFRVNKPNSTNRICVCGYLVCLDFE